MIVSRISDAIAAHTGAQLVDPGLLAIYGLGGLQLIYENTSHIVAAGLLAGLLVASDSSTVSVQ